MPQRGVGCYTGPPVQLQLLGLLCLDKQVGSGVLCDDSGWFVRER